MHKNIANENYGNDTTNTIYDLANFINLLIEFARKLTDFFNTLYNIKRYKNNLPSLRRRCVVAIDNNQNDKTRNDKNDYLICKKYYSYRRIIMASYLKENSHEAANRVVRNKLNRNQHQQTPVCYIDKSKTELYQDFPIGDQIAKATFINNLILLSLFNFV